MRHTMTTLLLAASASAMAVCAASAADLPSRRTPAPYLPIAPVFTWTGFYAGVNVGGGEGSSSTRNTGVTAGAIAALGAGTRPTGFGNDREGIVGGGQIGYNYQIGNLVLGAEADADYTGFARNRGTIGTTGLTSTARDNLGYLGTVRGRVGYAWDRLLVYGTGGLAYGDVYNRQTFYNAAGNPALSGSRSATDTGWAAGGGIEYALATDNMLNFFHASAVTLRAEYLHYDLGRRTVQVNGLANGVDTYTDRVKNDGDIGRIGLNYKF